MSDNSVVADLLEASSLQTINTTTITNASMMTTSNIPITSTTNSTTTTSISTPSTTPGQLNRDGMRRLFMGNLPKVKSEVEICDEVSRITDGLVRVITYKNFENPMLHRGFCFLDYGSSAAAAEAKHRLSRCTVFGCKTIVDWADPEPEPDAQQMAAVRILFVRQYGGTLDERTLADIFGKYGTVERVKNLKNYAFVHFERRSDAKDAMDALDGVVDEATGVRIDVSWAKPPAEKHVRERVLRDRERRIKLQTLQGFHRSEHKADPSKFKDKTSDTTVSGFASNTDIGSTVPYSNYDHYVYDFGGQTCDCMCRVQQTVDAIPLQRQPELQRRQPEQGQSCRQCISKASGLAPTATSSVNSNRQRNDRDNNSAQTRWPRLRISHQHRDTAVTNPSTARYDHGDCVNKIPRLDSIILHFFHKISRNQ